MRLTAQPVRTDFNLTDTGTLQVNGTWQRSGTLSETPLKFTARWDGAQLGELTKLLYGRDIGWRGALLVAADLAGTPADLSINLKASVDNFRRYDIVAQQSLRLATSCQARYSSLQRAVSDVLCTSPVGRGVISVKGQIQSPTGPRTYDLKLMLDRIPIQSMADLARRSKKNLPDDLTAAGTIDGSFSLRGSQSSREGLEWRGSGSTDHFVLRSAASKNELALGTVPFGTQSNITPAASKSNSQFQARSDIRFIFGPFTIALGKQGSATVLGWATASGYRLGIQGEGAVQRVLQLAEMGGVQVPQMTADGDAKFNFVMAGDWHGFEAPRPTGTVLLRSVKAQLPGMNGIMDIRSANVILDSDSVQVRNVVAFAGGANWEGSLSLPRPCHLLSGCPVRFHLRSDTVAAERLHQWLSPINRSRAWYRFAGFGSNSPSLLSSIHASGTIAAKRLVVRGITATDVSCELEVRDGNLHFSGVTANILGGKHRGDWIGNLAVNPPEFSGTGEFEHITLVQLAEAMHDGWITGMATGSYEFSASGRTAQDWFASGKGMLLFDMRDGSLPHIVIATGAGPLRVRRFTGRLQLQDRTFEFAKGKLETATSSYDVTGNALPGQKLQMKLARSGGGFLIDGTLSSPHVAPIAADTRASLKP
jgi:hypothetical protein